MTNLWIMRMGRVLLGPEERGVLRVLPAAENRLTFLRLFAEEN
jgi:hypothetical protein